MSKHLGVLEAAKLVTTVRRGREVAFEIDPRGEQVKLTVIHDDLLSGGVTGSLISEGWPRVVANLKALL